VRRGGTPRRPAWEVVDLPPVERQRKNASPALDAYLTIIIDFLEQDPALVAAAFRVRRSGNDLVLYFPARRGFLRYRVVEPVRTVYLVGLVWL
jgi:hypothetical protein